MKSIKKIVTQILLLAVCMPAFAQLSGEVRVNDVSVNYANDKVNVPYKIINSKQDDRYVVWVSFYNEKNELLSAKSISGDVDVVKGSGQKNAVWDVKADGVVLNEKIYAKVNAKLLPQASTGKAFAYSTIFPGTGNYQFKTGKPYWLKGVLAYGLLGGAVGVYGKAATAYDSYLGSDIPSADDPNYKTAMKYRQTSLIMAGVGLGIWLIDYAGILSKSAKNKNIKPQSVITDSGYKMYAASSPAQQVNTRSLPPNLFADLSFSDDNGNGILENRENAELRINISNQGSGDAMLLNVNVSSNFNDKSFKLQNASQAINLIKPGESKQIVIPITTDIDLKTASHRLTINVSEHYGYDMDPAFLVLNTFAYQPPKFVVSGHEIIDAGVGTGAITSDGKLQAGEQVKAKLVIQNIGQGEAKNAKFNINTTDNNIFIDQIEGALGDFLPGEVKEVYFTLSPNKRVTTKDKLPLFLTINEEIGRGSMKNEKLPIALDQKPPQANIVEIKSDVESLKKNVARFEYTSNKFRANISNVVNIASVAPSQTKRPNSVGVVIGVSKYKDIAPAPYADNDAKIMKEYFEKVLGVEQVIQFTNEQVAGFFFDDIFNPDLGELRKAIIKGESEVFVFYSGHGVPDKDGKNVYLFPSDGKMSRLENQGYNLEKMYTNLKEIGAKHVTVILDACFSGASRSSVKVATENLIGQKGVKVRPRNSWIGDPGFTVITSSTGEETSLGFDDTQTGLFTYFLAAGLQGKADANNDKAITLGELREYVISNVKETSNKISGMQTPIFSGDDSIILTTF